MTSRDFCYWLQGFYEITGPSAEITRDQNKILLKHLAMVFKHEIDPSFPDNKELSKIHISDSLSSSILSSGLGDTKINC